MNIVYEDRNILIINKEHGVPVVKDCKDIGRKCLLDEVKEKFNALLVHRLDAGTAGLIIFVKNKKVQKNLSEQFEKGIIKKEYNAIVKGLFLHNISCGLPISKKNYHGKYKIDFKDGRKCKTSFFVLARDKNKSLLNIKLYTGRTHQIRVHLKALKYPLYFDYQYNRNTSHKEKRLTLMCKKLILKHPITKEKMCFEIGMSDLMKEIWNNNYKKIID